MTDYFESTLPPEMRRRFDAHLDRCAACQTYVAQMRTTIALTGRLREDDLAPETRDRLLDLFRHWAAR